MNDLSPGGEAVDYHSTVDDTILISSTSFNYSQKTPTDYSSKPSWMAITPETSTDQSSVTTQEPLVTFVEAAGLALSRTDFARCVGDERIVRAALNASAVGDNVRERLSMFHMAELDEAWLAARLIDGCNCTALSFLNADRASIFCIEFPVRHSVLVQLCYICLFTLLIGLSCAGNIAVVWIILKHERMRATRHHLYLLNLAISDLAITILNTGFSGTYNFYYHWIFSEAHCAFNNLMGITPICASVFTMIVMSIDRYLAVVHPLRQRPGQRATLTIIVAIWILAFLCGLPALYSSDVESYFFVNMNGSDRWGRPEVFKDRLCLADRFPDGDSRTSTLFSWYNHSLVVIQYLLPLIILCFTYGKVVYVLKRNNTIGDTRHAENIKAKRKAANMLALVVFTFIFMWMPYNLYFLFLQPIIQKGLQFIATIHVYICIYCLGMSSCLLNPVIYYFMNERFRVGFRYAFRWIPGVRIKREDYESAFLVTSRVSYPTPKFSNTNNSVVATTVIGGNDSNYNHNTNGSNHSSPQRRQPPKRKDNSGAVRHHVTISNNNHNCGSSCPPRERSHTTNGGELRWCRSAPKNSC